MIKLMNSAMVPKAGKYVCSEITLQEFIESIKKAKPEEIDCCLGYQNTIDKVAKWTGKQFQISRKLTKIENGDIMLIMKLKYRIVDPKSKATLTTNDEDYEFFKATYEEN